MATTVSTMPRRWNVEVDGIKWLPRLIDKARMSESGVLGNYLLGHSPIDYDLLRAFGVSSDEFTGIAMRQPDDVGVLAALRVRGFDEATVRRWSDRLPHPYALFLRMCDLDEGHRVPSGLDLALKWVMGAIEVPVAAVMRKVRPLP